MAGRARFADIAAAAGVGTATVERVLNARGNVAPATVEKVLAAARRLGTSRRLPEIHRGTLRVEVVLMRPDTPFFRHLGEAFRRLASTLDPQVALHRSFLDENDPAAVAAHVAQPPFRRSALIIAAPDDPPLLAALRRVRAGGVLVVHVVSRIGEEDGAFVGIDNYAAGRTAGFYMSGLLRGREGRFLRICHGAAYRVHQERIRGFADYLGEKGWPGHGLGAVLSGGDDPLRTTELLEEALRRDAGAIGVYNAGGGAEGVASVLGREERAGRIFWVGHELTAESRLWLRAGLMGIVLDQAPETQARRALDAVLHALGLTEAAPPAGPVPFLTYNAENV